MTVEYTDSTVVIILWKTEAGILVSNQLQSLIFVLMSSVSCFRAGEAKVIFAFIFHSKRAFLDSFG